MRRVYSRTQGVGVRIRQFNTAGVSNVAHDENFAIENLHEGYRSGRFTPSEILQECARRLQVPNNAFIFKVPSNHFLSKASQQDALLKKAGKKGFDDLLKKYPLFGVPFSVKDNLDVAGFPTTAACPKFSYTPWESSPLVDKAEENGAILVGKNNMDQFAAGLVGVRSPYGIPVNPFDARYCPGGSSSGSGVAVSTQQVTFSFGTDTAGSGRVPASFTNVVGLKPTRGVMSTRGVFPACRSLDCPSIFASSADDAWKVFNICKGFDSADDFSRPEGLPPLRKGSGVKFGFPQGKGLAFFGDSTGAPDLYHDARKVLLEKIPNSSFVEIDFQPFTDVARVLYEGPWTAERLSAIDQFFKSAGPDDMHPVTRGIMQGGSRFSAVDTFKAFRKLEHLRRVTSKIWEESGMDVLVVPTASITPTVQEVLDVPVGINTVLGYYVNFVNLTDLCALAVPNGFLPNGMPTGISLIGRAFNDELLYRVGRVFQAGRDLPLGATQHKLPASAKTQEIFSAPSSQQIAQRKEVDVVVAGAHMQGLPLNKQLLDLGATFVSATRTSADYKLYDISQPGETLPPRPGIIRTTEGGNKIAVEVWRMSSDAYGSFVANAVKPPLSIGNISMESGQTIQGFLCEPYIVPKAKDITAYGGWRGYIQKKD